MIFQDNYQVATYGSRIQRKKKKNFNLLSIKSKESTNFFFHPVQSKTDLRTSVYEIKRTELSFNFYLYNTSKVEYIAMLYIETIIETDTTRWCASLAEMSIRNYAASFHTNSSRSKRERRYRPSRNKLHRIQFQLYIIKQHPLLLSRKILQRIPNSFL